MARRPSVSWTQAKASELERRLLAFDAAGDLSRLSPDEVGGLVSLLNETNLECWQLLQEHERSASSAVWLVLSLFSGLGGLPFAGSSALSVLLAAAGAAGAAKAVYDESRHLATEQRYLGIFWAIENRKALVETELRRRGILSPTAP
ncbi:MULTISPECIES: hypothetical protein [Rhodopseudomonas]|uniref:Uncharacterized protein n=1 Tax=Rhodopseudomonas palustris TaxID=1076 RepID=A0A0D7EZK8_RHOPL|nr:MULTISPECIES: hypothetical protein [Rhodopseudomonas]KIZ46274.1 hypothetical protein OO17_06925 [Rhodopseudomonas palustris]MDF3813511.1 hypothetical protein [Rhodopseudomonas sp. BAL398]WOK15362.1 hypothetical protein RBJ75_14270 [Rhodopseudomonas sp. BAL398]